MTGRLHRGGIAPVVLALLAGAGAAGATVSLRAYSIGPPVAHTGGFGEPTCVECHADVPPDSAHVALDVPESYEPGATYTLRVRVERDGLRRAGFQLAARFAGGAQAGVLTSPTERVKITADSSTAVLYASHSVDGTAGRRTGVVEWSISWIAPAGGGPVDFHIAANASNDDFSEFGDVIVTASRRAGPQKVEPAAGLSRPGAGRTAGR